MDKICINNNFCCKLSEATQNRLCKACVKINVKPKQEVVFEATADQVAIIHNGVLISFQKIEDGETKSLELIKTGDLIGADNLFNQGPKQTKNLLSLTETTLCLFSIEVFETFYQQSTDFSQRVVQSLSTRFRKSLDTLLLLQTFTSEDRVRYVLDLLEGEGIDLTYITHQDIALISNLNRVTVTKAIKIINQMK